MTKRQVNVRVSEGTRTKLDYLADRYGTQAEAIAVAIELLYTRELEQGIHEGNDQS